MVERCSYTEGVFSPVEFPAVLLDVSNGEVVSTFQKYVLPIEQPTLSDFCKQLTGITQVKI